MIHCDNRRKFLINKSTRQTTRLFLFLIITITSVIVCKALDEPKVNNTDTNTTFDDLTLLDETPLVKADGLTVDYKEKELDTKLDDEKKTDDYDELASIENELSDKDGQEKQMNYPDLGERNKFFIAIHEPVNRFSSNDKFNDAMKRYHLWLLENTNINGEED